MLIFYGHCFWVAGGPPSAGAVIAVPDNIRWTPLLFEGQTSFRYMLVPMFFAVSGFLVTGSAFRTNSLRTFMTFRVLRIVPALFTEVVLSALLLGPMLTTWRLKDYFFDPEFFHYFGNIIGRVRLLLPGVFLDNPATRAVNVNLWTLPAEFYCYLIVAALLAANILSHRKIFSLAFAAVTACLIFENLTVGVDVEHASNAELSNVLIVYYFFCGCLIYHWREYIPMNFGLFAACLGASYLLYQHKMIYLAPLLVSYVIIYIGMTKFSRIELVQRGDYSYGVYLYGFPIAQAMIVVFPQLRGHGWLLLAVSVPVVFAFATFSWHVLEKPALSLKRLFARTPKPAAA